MSRGKTADQSRKPKGHADDLEKREDFRFGDSIFLLDRKPIWMTPGAPSSEISNVAVALQSED